MLAWITQTLDIMWTGLYIGIAVAAVLVVVTVFWKR